MNAHEFPYNAAISNQDGETRISTTVAADHEPKVIYGLTVAAEGTQPQGPMKEKLDLLQHSFKQME
jgi:hypothetical protein